MSDYWDEELNGGGSPAPETPAAPAVDVPAPTTGGDPYATASAYSYPGTWSEITDAFSVAFGGDPSRWPSWITSSDAFQKNMAPKAQEGGGLLDKASNFVNKHKTLTEMVLRGVSGAVSERQKRQAAMAQLREQERQKIAEAQRMSASVSGLRAPGLIGKQMALRRTDGTPIYKGGLIGG